MVEAKEEAGEEEEEDKVERGDDVGADDFGNLIPFNCSIFTLTLSSHPNDLIACSNFL